MAVLVADEFQTAAFGLLPPVGDRRFEDVSPFISDLDGGALEGEFKGVSIKLLQQAAAGTEGDVVGGEPVFLHGGEDFVEHVEVDGVSLDEPDVVVQDLEAFRIDLAAELLIEDMEHLDQDRRRVARVGADDQRSVACQDFVAEPGSPDIAAGLENIERIADAGEQSAWELGQHVRHGVRFAVLAPRGDRAVLGRRNGEPGHLFAVEIPRRDAPFERVGPQETHQVGRVADAGRLHRGNAAKPEIVQLEADALRRAGRVEILQNQPLHLPALRGDGTPIPGLHQQRLQIVRQPVALRIGILDRHQHVMIRHDRPLRHGTDRNRQTPAVFLDDMLPRRTMEQPALRIAEVLREERGRFVDVLAAHDAAFEVPLQVVLQPEEEDVLESTAARLEIRINGLRIRRILPPVGNLVAVRTENQVVGNVNRQNVSPV